MRVMTFNVRGSFHEDGANNWPDRRDLNIATIIKYAPDVVGFQEAQSGNLTDYETGLTDYDVELGPISIRQAENYHRVPLYWKRERFEKLDSGSFYLSETPDEWSLSWGSRLVRAANWVKLRDTQSVREFVVVNTHFPHEPEAHNARVESARLVIRRLDQLAEPDIPRIVMADFNALPGSEPYRVFLEGGYQDTFDTAGDAVVTNTFHGFRGADFKPTGLRIDWILVRGFQTRRCEIITDAAPPLYPSDHYPLLAELEL